MQFEQQICADFFVTVLAYKHKNPNATPLCLGEAGSAYNLRCLDSLPCDSTCPNMRTLRAGTQTYGALCGLVPDVLGRHPWQDEGRGKFHLIGPPARHACMFRECQWSTTVATQCRFGSPVQVAAGFVLTFHVACSSSTHSIKHPAVSAS